MESLPGVELVGLMGFGGHSYAQEDAAGIERVARAEAEQLIEIAHMLRHDGFAVPELSAGSTPTSPYVARVPGITEIRPGTYVFSDRDQVALGWGTLDDCALALLVTVVSRPTPTRAIIDGGTKTFGADQAARVRGWGAVRGHPDYTVARLTEEHGILELPPGTHLPIGTRLEIIPNHACGALTMHDRVSAVRDDEVVEVWPVAARGCVQ
jgi:D-serine deaminase-like pyridoxal phosphate-dependent protein